MESTPVTLLQRLCSADPSPAWPAFVDLFTPLLCRWAGELGLRGPDADDLVQDVFADMLRALPAFTYRPDQSFRAWLRTVAVNRWRKRARRPVPAGLNEIPEPFVEPDPFPEAEYRRELMARALTRLEGQFEPATWRAWQASAIDGRPAAEVANELGVSVNAVYLARSRVLRRLKQEIGDMLGKLD